MAGDRYASMSRDRARLGAAFALGALVVLFAALNLDEVKVNWVFGTWRTPLIVVIVVCLLAGGALGLVLSRRRSP